MLASVLVKIFTQAQGGGSAFAGGAGDLHGRPAVDITGDENAGHSCFETLVALDKPDFIELDGTAL